MEFYWIAGLVLLFALSMWRLHLGVAVVVLLMPAYLVRTAILGVPTTLLELALYVVCFAWLVQRLVWENFKIKRTGFGVPLGLLLLAATIGIVVTPNMVDAVGIWKAYFVDALLFFLLFTAVIKRENIKWILAALALGGVFIAGVSYHQVITGSGLVNRWLDMVGAPSIYNSPNAVGLFLAPIAALFLGLGFLVREKSTKVLTLLVVGFLLGGIYLSFSRGAWLGFIAALVFVVLFTKRRWIYLAVTAGFGTVLVFLPMVWSKVEKILSGDYSTLVRFKLWEYTYKMFLERPVYGNGLSGFQPALKAMPKHPELVMHPHNFFLNFWTEVGLLGLLAIVWVVARFFVLGSRVYKGFRKIKDITGKALSVGVMAMMVALLTHSMVDTQYFKNDLAILFMATIGLMVVLGRSSVEKVK